MRQLVFQVPRGRGALVMARARARDARNLHCVAGEGPDGPLDVVVAHVPNRAVEPLLAEVQEEVPEVRVTLMPQGVMALHPPPDEAPRQVVEVQPRSPLEIFLAGLQSVGSWKGFLGYAAAGGAIAWVGLLTNTIYLLVAAMLVAPYAGPAMNAALSTARGDAVLLGRSLARYLGALGVSAAIAALLTWLFRVEGPTPLMVDVANLSSVSVVLPLTAGAAGALNLAQSERNSLVSGAAVGILVAASLAPPVGVAGMALVLGEWGLAWSAAFVLALQLVGINVAGALVFRLFGLDPDGVRYHRGSRWVSRAALAASVVLLAGLVAWQLHDPTSLERETLAQRADRDARQAVEATGLARAIDVEARFPRADAPAEHPLLLIVHVQPTEGTDLPREAIEARVEEAIEARLRAEGYDATPLVDVRVVEA